MKNEAKNFSVLIIDDEQDLVDLLEYKFSRYGCDVSTVTNSMNAMARAREIRPDVIILDVMMPEPSGLKLLAMMKQDHVLERIPVLMLTAASKTESRIDGLIRGADDYVSKPFDFKELLVRTKALVRRTVSLTPKDEPLVNGQLVVDPHRHAVFYMGNSVSLTALEFKLIDYFLRNAGVIASRRQLLDHVWGYPPDMNTRLVDVNVRRLREKFGPNFHMIVTIRGVGYRLDKIR